MTPHPRFIRPAEPTQPSQPWALRPLPALGIGFLLVPLMKLLWIPNYVFNFLTTLIHEIGHTVFGWLMGMPSMPQVGLFGGGVTPAFAQIPLLCCAIFAGLGWFAWQAREDRRWLIATLVVMVVYALLAFKAAETVLTAGGVLFEIGGACACFYWVFAGPSDMGVERPLYALWGWWMLLNRLTETWLMLRDSSYWDEHIIIKSGLSEGLVNDLPRLCEIMDLEPKTILSVVLVLCLSAVPVAFGLAQLKRKFSAP